MVMLTKKDVLLIADPYDVPVVMLGSWAIGTGMCLLLDPGAGFWACVFAGFLIGLILSLPMAVLLALALWAVALVIGTVEVVCDAIRWRRAEGPDQGRR